MTSAHVTPRSCMLVDDIRQHPSQIAGRGHVHAKSGGNGYLLFTSNLNDLPKGEAHDAVMYEPFGNHINERPRLDILSEFKLDVPKIKFRHSHPPCVERLGSLDSEIINQCGIRNSTSNTSRPAPFGGSGSEPGIPSSDAGGAKMGGSNHSGRSDEKSAYGNAKSERATHPSKRTEERGKA